ncbi:aromatic amino acid lyase [Oscillibacter sp.]|uniref:aromatic amino acid lyase n=1 Tax=Oscillibacter sp. TaxID=1945593 RepID=UPI00289A88A8|nr:aromatic amino acid lyase [Oscillibacter sp.]
MPGAKTIRQVKLGEKIGLQDLVAAARFGAKVEFSESYCDRVNRSRYLIEQAISQERVMYGVTTGFGLLSTKTIDREQAKTLQKNIILSHSVSVGEPFDEEQARATMLMILQNLGQGYSGVRLGTLETIRSMLNGGVTPWMPRCHGTAPWDIWRRRRTWPWP